MAKANMEMEVTISNVGMLTEVPDFLKDKIQGQGRGNEAITMQDLVMPRLEQVQALSKCVSKSEAGYIPGAEAGMLYNSVTREIYGEEVDVCFADFEVQFCVWKTGATGLFRGNYSTLEEANEACKEKAREEKCDVSSFEVVKTHVHYGLIINNEGKMQGVSLSMSKSKMKPSKMFNSLVNQLGGDRFARVYRVKAVADKSEKGAFFNVKITPVGFPSEAVYKRAEEVYGLAKAGTLQTDYDDVSTDTATTDSEEF